MDVLLKKRSPISTLQVMVDDLATRLDLMAPSVEALVLYPLLYGITLQRNMALKAVLSPLVSTYSHEDCQLHLTAIKLTNIFLDDIMDAEYDELRHALEHWGIT
jgi:hypothetical protein